MSSSRRKAASAPASPAAAASPYARPAKLPAASGVGMVAGEPLEDDPTDEDLKEMITSAIDSLSDPPTATRGLNLWNHCPIARASPIRPLAAHAHLPPCASYVYRSPRHSGQLMI